MVDGDLEPRTCASGPVLLAQLFHRVFFFSDSNTSRFWCVCGGGGGSGGGGVERGGCFSVGPYWS